MRSRFGIVFMLLAGACAGHNEFGGPDGEAPTDGGSNKDAPFQQGDSGDKFGDASSDAPIGNGVTTVYANTDTALYTLNPQTNAVTLIGNFAGMSNGTNDTTITDVAVNSTGDVYVNSESVIYKANVPTSPGTVQLTKLASISLQTGQKFYALAFTPAGSLASNEILIGGDDHGELWAIDTTNGKTKDLGSFGVDPSHSGYDFALSGDLVFYNDAKNNPTGLATVRPCKPNTTTTTCITSSDYLISVDMTALANAYKTSAGASLKKGVYGGSTSSDGTGTGYGDLFGLGAWEGTVFAFARKTGSNATPLLLTINTTTGAGTVVSSNFNFTNGWSGAGVTTSVTVTVPPPN